MLPIPTDVQRLGVSSHERRTLEVVMAEERRPSNGQWQSYIALLVHLLGDDLAFWVEHIPETTVVVDCLARGLPRLGIAHPEV